MKENCERVSLNYTNFSHKFAGEVANYNKQYCCIYLVRLQQVTKFLEEQIEKKWKSAYPVCKLHKLSEEKHATCIVIGTIFKDQKLKPSILKQLSEGHNNIVPQPISTHLTDKSDILYIEDELERYQIVGFLNCDTLVTGVSCALLGSDDGNGKFTVKDCVFAGYRSQIDRPIITDSSFIVFISGLDIVNSHNFAVNLQLLTYWLYGLVGDLNETSSSKIARVIIAGNSVRTVAAKQEPSISLLSRRPGSPETIEATKTLDKFLLKLINVIDVDLMPGENDPSNYNLPQKPMHFCMFPESAGYKSLNRVSNPYYCSLEGLKILGTSGQPVRDIMRFSEISDPLDVLESCLNWSHLAPTAPDTLGSFPFYESDPFVIEECPHVFFAGNQEKFDTRECTGPDGQKVRLLGIPEFGTSSQVCLMDLRTLNCTSLSFKADL